jgi:hypothetical protein
LGPEGAILPALFRIRDSNRTDLFIWATGLFDFKQLPAWGIHFIAQDWRFALLSLTVREHGRD